MVPRVETLYSSAELGRFEVEPLASGFGLTMGNALRRVLLSSLNGAAITAMRIEDVYHEFSAIPGVREDTTELILNLKQVRLKSYTDQPVNVRLEGTGPGVLTAGDIQVPPEIEIVNPELPIATLDNRDARLSMLLTVEMGAGYLTAEGRESPAIGVIPIDAVFTPIRRVNFQVEKTRVGERTDYDKLLLEIQTDGTITPKDALSQAAKILVEHLEFLIELDRTVPRADSKSIAPGPIPSQLQEMPIEVLDLSSRTYNCLKRSQITTVGQVLQMSEEELLGLRNFGQKSLVELQEKLAQHGIIRSGEVETGDGPAYRVVGPDEEEAAGLSADLGDEAEDEDEDSEP
ncbi:MAG: DNA-directed RNA polymerase subunit alpha [Chloroflexi bacterium]|nr:DNA-directed RNA polymerase subunit alpha [Chloroflexota bacterium]